jgi:hypothetical protein
MDFKLLMNSFAKEDLIYWHLERLETNMQKLYEAGQYGGVFVEDFTGLSMAHWYKPAVEFLKEMMATDQQNYPELSRAIFYINAPRVLSVLWPLLKPLMDPLTVAKVIVFVLLLLKNSKRKQGVYCFRFWRGSAGAVHAPDERANGIQRNLQQVSRQTCRWQMSRLFSWRTFSLHQKCSLQHNQCTSKGRNQGYCVFLFSDFCFFKMCLFFS